MIANIFKKSIFIAPKSCIQPTYLSSFSFCDGKFNFKREEEMQKANPFFNPMAANIKADIDYMSGSIKSWHADFKKQHNRKPTLDEMREDPDVGPQIKAIERQK